MAAASGAAGGGATPAPYNDDSILQALRRLQPDELIKHMLETEDWSERLTSQCGEELSRGAALNLFVPPRDGAQVKSELDAVASSVAALAGPSLAAAAAAAAHRPQQSAGQPEHLIEQTMQALSQPAQPTAAANDPHTGHGVSPGNPPSYPY